jgi:hypothetical protein
MPFGNPCSVVVWKRVANSTAAIDFLPFSTNVRNDSVSHLRTMLQLTYQDLYILIFETLWNGWTFSNSLSCDSASFTSFPSRLVISSSYRLWWRFLGFMTVTPAMLVWGRIWEREVILVLVVSSKVFVSRGRLSWLKRSLLMRELGRPARKEAARDLITPEAVSSCLFRSRRNENA